jgi:ribonuclease HI
VVLVVYFDGLCEPVNPGGVAAYGFVVYSDGRRLHAGRGVAGAGYLGGDVTNNVAEYTALIKALEWLVENGFSGEELVVRGDSQLVIRQLNGEYAVKSPRIAPLYARVKELLRFFQNVKLEWVPRELNAEADALSRAAYEEFLREHPEALRVYNIKAKSRFTLR